jgi:hypothetical protein
MNEEIIELNNKTAYKRGYPIIEASQMSFPVAWDTTRKGNPRWNGDSAPQLRSKLLTFGGSVTIIPDMEEDLDKIIDRGQFWYGHKAKIMRGVPSQCHKNSCDLWHVNRDNPDVELYIATGYALSSDGLWRQHSWLVLITPRGCKIIETTERRVAYFGFVMTESEAQVFDSDNL